MIKFLSSNDTDLIMTSGEQVTVGLLIDDFKLSKCKKHTLTRLANTNYHRFSIIQKVKF